MSMKWYVIHTQSGYESKLKIAIENLAKEKKLQKYFGEIIVPEVEIEEKKNGKKKLVKKNLYPGYVFIEMDYNDEAWFLVKSVAFTRKPAFVGERKRFNQKGEARPSPITQAEIERIKKMIEDGEIKTTRDISFEKGEMILIKDGPFAGFKAIIDDVKEGKEKLDVLVNIFGRSTPVELNFSQVEKVED